MTDASPARVPPSPARGLSEAAERRLGAVRRHLGGVVRDPELADEPTARTSARAVRLPRL